jgi:hypothetical protein
MEQTLERRIESESRQSPERRDSSLRIVFALLILLTFGTSGFTLAQPGASGQADSDATDPLSRLTLTQTLAAIQTLIPASLTVRLYLGATEYSQTLAYDDGTVTFANAMHFLDQGRTARVVSTAALKDLDWNSVKVTLRPGYFHLSVDCRGVNPGTTGNMNCVRRVSDFSDTGHHDYEDRGIEISFQDADSTQRAAVAVKHLMVLDGIERGVAVNVAPPPPENFTKGPMPDVVATLNRAVSQKIVLSLDDYRKLNESAAELVNKANRNDYADHGGGASGAPAAAVFASLGESALGMNDPRIELAYQRACAVPYNEASYVNFCADLGKYYERRGNPRMALAVYTQAPRCLTERPINARVGPRCLAGAARLYDIASDEVDAAREYGEMCTNFSIGCEEFNRLGGHVDLAAAEAQHQTNIQEQKDELRQETEERAERARQSDARFNAVLGALQGMPGGNNPNAILDESNRQAPAIAAVGARNAQRNAPAEQQRAVVQPVLATAPTAPALSNSATTDPVRPPSDPQSAVAPTLLTPLAAGCVRQFWDPQYYNWLSLENDCGQPIYLEFIFKHNVGWAMTGSMNLALGSHSNTGRSSSDINQAGGFDLYVCPANSVPVDQDNGLLQANVASYRCRPE